VKDHGKEQRRYANDDGDRKEDVQENRPTHLLRHLRRDRKHAPGEGRHRASAIDDIQRSCDTPLACDPETLRNESGR